MNSSSSDTAYRVLARKYRPQRMDGLIGQDGLVTTLSNAIERGRLAHAFMLTGVRGVGKTSTARILATGLNCMGHDGGDKPTLNPCGSCASCVDIGQGRHIDVLEMDAASHTGVDDVRDIIDGSAYRPVSARFKIYIIDEVHMLSKSAFNALLKTLEEPPEKVKFIFATTEIRKVPATILSRCQRFDLKRVSGDVLAAHLGWVCSEEQISAEEPALRLIAQAAEGSVRDSLSLLDQAAALSADQITEQMVVSMLGQAGAFQIAGILAACLDGQAGQALEQFARADDGGAEPETILADMLEICHQASLMAAGASLPDLPEGLKQQISELAAQGIARLGRAWQVLLSGHKEVGGAPNRRSAAQMVLIRLAHIAPMPTPAEIIRKLPEAPQPASHPAPMTASEPSSPAPASQLAAATEAPAASSDQPHSAPISSSDTTEETRPSDPPQPEVEPAAKELQGTDNQLNGLAEIAELAEQNGAFVLSARLRQHIRPVSMSPGRLEIQLDGGTEDDFIPQLARQLSSWTGQQWLISVREAGGGKTLNELKEDDAEQQRAQLAQHPDVAAVLNMFDSATITNFTPASSQSVQDDEVQTAPDTGAEPNSHYGKV